MFGTCDIPVARLTLLNGDNASRKTTFCRIAAPQTTQYYGRTPFGVTVAVKVDYIRKVMTLEHPDAHLCQRLQAAMGTWLCSMSSDEYCLIVETHSDYLVDRVRMEVRDNKKIHPEHVIILFFEREGTKVKIHPIEFDKNGNVNGAPASYRRFCLEETERSITETKGIES